MATTTHTPNLLSSTVTRLLVSVAAVVAVALIALAPAASAKSHGHHARAQKASACANADTPVVQASPAQMRAAVVCVLNEQRRSFGLPALRQDARLDRSAQGWTNRMVSHRSFDHGANFSGRISAAGFNWSNVGENIATGFATPAGVVKGWMASQGHCENMLSPTYREVGTGVSGGSIPGASNTAGTWTQDFGLIMGESPASHDGRPAAGCPYH